MPRKGPAPRRELTPDPVYRSVLVTQVVNKVLLRGKRSLAERIAAAFDLPETIKFVRARKLIRDALTESGIAPHIDELVARLLDQSPAPEDDASDA